PAVPPPITSTSQDTSEDPPTISSMAIAFSSCWPRIGRHHLKICSGACSAIAISCRRVEIANV
ncbi:MAG TPA: hypothetical protein VHB49_16410, partial [Bradyrhizobium sp.]|nr:hypothetical protein [Bradyrhizobium sp.]